LSLIEAITFVATGFSIILAVFALWMANQQLRESRANYDSTKALLSKIEKVMEKTELLVSENFQKLLQSMVDQQNKMIEHLKPKITPEEVIFKLAQEDPEKLDKVAEAVIKISQAQPQSQGDFLQQLIKLSLEQQQPPRR